VVVCSPKRRRDGDGPDRELAWRGGGSASDDGGGDDGPEASLMDSISSAVACGRDTALRDDGDDPPEDYAPISLTLSAALGV
jgi:hypothetical protein